MGRHHLLNKFSQIAFCWPILMTALCTTTLPISEALATPATVDALMNTLSTPDSFTVNFEQKRHVKGLARPLPSSGYLTCIKGESIEWHTLKPLDTKVTLRDGVVIEEVAGEAPVEKDQDAVQSKLAEILMAIFTGDKAELEEVFNLDFSLQKVADAETFTLTLTPSSGRVRSRLELVTLEGTETPEQMSVKFSSDNRIELTFSEPSQTINADTNQSLKDE